MTYIVALLMAYRWMILIGGTLLLLVVLFATRGRPKASAAMGCIMPAFIVGVMMFGFFGTSWSTRLIYANGEEGQAVTTGQFATATLYNEEPVLGFNVLIRTADGGLVKSTYRTDSFNVYPPTNLTTYPAVGARFNVRYVPGHPEYFVIVSNDDSPWARKRACNDVLRSVAAAQQQVQFEPNDAGLQAELDRATDKARANGCLE